MTQGMTYTQECAVTDAIGQLLEGRWFSEFRIVDFMLTPATDCCGYRAVVVVSRYGVKYRGLYTFEPGDPLYIFKPVETAANIIAETALEIAQQACDDVVSGKAERLDP